MVYVDNDPMVALHSQAIIEAGNAIAVICGDLRDPGSLSTTPSSRLIDSSQPTGLLHHRGA